MSGKETENLHKIIATLGEMILNLEEAGNGLVERMRSGSDSGWDEAIDKWTLVVNGYEPDIVEKRYKRRQIGTVHNTQ